MNYRKKSSVYIVQLKQGQHCFLAVYTGDIKNIKESIRLIFLA